MSFIAHGRVKTNPFIAPLGCGCPVDTSAEGRSTDRGDSRDRCCRRKAAVTEGVRCGKNTFEFTILLFLSAFDLIRHAFGVPPVSPVGSVGASDPLSHGDAVTAPRQGSLNKVALLRKAFICAERYPPEARAPKGKA